MENSWQSKCGSMWQQSSMLPPSPTVEASSSLNQHEQFLSVKRHACLQLPQESVLLNAHEMIQEPMFPCTTTYNSNHTEHGTRFLSLLSGSSSLLPCDVPRLSHPKPVLCSSHVPTNNSATGSAMGTRVSLLPGWLWSQNMDCQIVKSGADICPAITSSGMACLNHTNGSGLKLLQAAHSNLRKSQLARVGLPNETDLVKDFSSLMGVNNPGENSTNILKLQNGANVIASQKLPLQNDFSGCGQLHNLPTGCPRVLCSGTSGDLFLSNTGFLGVVCSCHGFYMSISKFTEHSGLCSVSPGNAVCLDNGDTIAHWRKTYFSKTGIRIPEDHRGWDWPEEFSAASGLKNHILSNMSKHTGLFNQDCSLGTSGGSGQPKRHGAYHKDQHSGRNMVDGFHYNERQGNSQECNPLFKNFIGTSHSNLHPAAYSHKTCTSKSVDRSVPEKASESITAGTDANLKSAGPFNVPPIFQNVGSDLSKVISSNREVLPVSSNIDLRLGQLPKHTQTLGSSASPAFGLQLMDTQSEPRKSYFPDQLLHKTGNYGLSDRVHQTHQVADIISNTSERRETSQLNHVRGAFDSLFDYWSGPYNGGVERGALVLPLRSCFKNLERNSQLKNVSEIADGRCVATNKSHSNSHSSNCDQRCFPWSCGAGNIMDSDATMLNTPKHLSKSVGTECIVNGLLGASENENFGIPRMYKETLSPFNVAPFKSNSAFHEGNPTACHRSAMISNESCPTDTLTNSCKISPISHTGRSAFGYPKPFISPVDSGATFSLGFSSTNSLYVQDNTPALSKKRFNDVTPGLLEENMKMLSMQYMLEPPNRHAASSVKDVLEPEMLNQPCVEPKVTIALSMRKGHVPVLDGSSMQKMSEAAPKSTLSAATFWRDLSNEKLVLPTEGTFCAEACGVQRQRSCDLHPMEPLFLRLGKNKSNITSSEQEALFQGLPYAYVSEKCSCAVSANCLAGKDALKDGTFYDSLVEQEGIANAKSTSLFKSMLGGSSIFSKEKAISACDSGDLEPKNMETLESHSFRWKAVPSKVMETCSSTRKQQQAGSIHGNGNVEGSAAAKCFARSAQNAEPLKEHERSNISSGCSAPVSTWASIEVNKRDSSTVDTGDVRCMDNIVDEGSRIDKSWSSDDTLDSERSADICGSAPRKKTPSYAVPRKSALSLVQELWLRDSSRTNKAHREFHSRLSKKKESDHLQKSTKGSKKMKKTVKWKRLDAAFHVSGHSSYNGSSKCTEDNVQNSNLVWDQQMRIGRQQKHRNNCARSGEPSIKRRRTGWPSTNLVSNNGNFCTGYREVQKTETKMHSRVHDDTSESPETLGKKRLKLYGVSATSLNLCGSGCDNAEAPANSDQVDCFNYPLDQHMDFYKWRAKPVVCGKYGIISNGNSSKSPKIVPLWKILETAGECDDKNIKVKSMSAKKLKKGSIRHVKETSRDKELLKREYHDALGVEKSGAQNVLFVNFEAYNSPGETERALYPGINGRDEALQATEKRRNANCSRNHSIVNRGQTVQQRTKCKEVRKRSLYDLILKGNNSEVSNFSTMKNPESLLQSTCRPVGALMHDAGDENFPTSEVHNAKRCRGEHLKESIDNLDGVCCLCGSSDKTNSDNLLECSRCLIKVHQACYGVSNVLKNQWHCRPCETNSKNIVCVLCGHGGGAMTQALQSQNVVKSLLQSWNAMSKSTSDFTISTDNSIRQLSTMACGSDLSPLTRLANMESSSITASNMNISKCLNIDNNLPPTCNSVLWNSTVADVLDSTVKQWVHVVCGLWTPGTRCPNDDTLNAFDVSGALSSKESVVCSICSRPGGSCIQCRVLDCSVSFHPWCAHQKGLLQAETEGNQCENIGFYGRCMVHASIQQFIPGIYPMKTESLHSGEKGLTCARTEGFRGHKNKVFWRNFSQESDRNGSCHVSQEQVNAWLHINRQKPHKRWLPKLPSSSVESDYRKEYVRYKHSKGWKHLVVYKSDIHALGLYTSQFISRGAMVVEYVGEIVGLRVADKREREYQSGKKLQYKSACYFFRIDKERIIDATRKGGIARFVNHSCQPNCVAKVISVRNEKKVLFSAERDIYPGEEITYDYHFNHEEEGEKIPCYCNSKNCRRYLN